MTAAERSPGADLSLVSTEWLANRLGQDGLRIVDATQFLPTAGRDGRAEYLQSHIPGAVFLDLKAASDPASALPNTLPNAAHFGRVLGALGIGNKDHIVVYDASGMLSAPRVWWMLRAFGHSQVSVLDGGFPKWQQEGRPVQAGEQDGAPTASAAVFRANGPTGAVDVGQVQQALAANTQIVDARSAARFEGSEPEPRPGLRSGHIPGSRNLPYNSLLRPDGSFLDNDGLAAKFAAAGIDTAQPVICSCGSGVSACVLALALHRLGRDQVSVYDGSWSEWGADPRLPLETGPQR